MAEEWAAALPGARVGLLHGRLKAPEKEAVMAAFAPARARRAGGHHRDRGGRGRAERDADGDRARGALRPGAAPPAPGARRARGAARPPACWSPTAACPRRPARGWRSMVRTDDGFVIAEKDLELRGPGDFFGTRQSGLPAFRVADLMRDRDLLETRAPRGLRAGCAGGARRAAAGAARVPRGRAAGSALRPGAGRLMTRDHRRGGEGAPAARRRPATPRGPPGARVSRRCSTSWPRGSPAAASSTRSRAAAASAWRRCRAARAGWCWSTRAARAVDGHPGEPRRWSRAGAEGQVFRQDARVALAALADRGERFDIVYLDPPYAVRPLRARCSQLAEAVPARDGGRGGGRALPQTRAPGDNRAPRPNARAVRVGRPPPHASIKARGERVNAAGARGSLAVFPGSFDPITNGHLDIIAARPVRLRRGAGRHPGEPGEAARCSRVEERVEIIRETYKGEPRVKRGHVLGPARGLRASGSGRR